MKRRIAISILLTVWCLLIAGAAVAYVTTRSVLLADLDDSLMRRAVALALSTAPANSTPSATFDTGGERYLITNDLGQTVSRPFGKKEVSPILQDARFSQVGDGPRQRTITVQVPVPAQDGAASHSLTITYSASAAHLDGLLNQLSLALGGVVIVAGLLAAGVAWKVSGIALRPLKTTAAQIGSIDEQSLDRRIDVLKLPPELLPMAERLNEMLQRLQEAFVRRQRFLADASHELRTPVASLATALEIALRYPQDARQFRQTLQTCFDEAKTLRHLVESLMEQVRGEQTAGSAGNAAARPMQWMDVAELLDSCLKTAAPLAAEKDVELCRRFNRPLEFPTHAGTLRSIVLNLVTNGIEYNRRGGRVDLICRLNEASSDLHLEVRDTGIGIAEKDLPRVFEPFFRASAARSATGHLGLGLALVQTNVRSMGGVCTVESSDCGTIFRIDLPCRLARAPSEASLKPEVEQQTERLAMAAAG